MVKRFEAGSQTETATWAQDEGGRRRGVGRTGDGAEGTEDVDDGEDEDEEDERDREDDAE